MYTIQMNGPAKNALGTEMMQWIQAELIEADGRPVLLTGTDDAFSVGLNLKELAGLDAEGMRSFLGELDGVVNALFHYPAPTAAAVNGHAIAGGCVLEMCCDVRISTANPRTRLGLNEVALGLRFPPRTLAMVNYRLPHRHSEQVLLGAQLHAPEQALGLGLVDDIAKDCVAEATRRLKVLGSHPVEAYQAAKATLRSGVGVKDDTADRDFIENVLPVWTSPEFKKMILGFLCKG